MSEEINSRIDDEDKAREMAEAELPLRAVATVKSAEFWEDFEDKRAIGPGASVRQESKRLDSVQAREAAIKAGERAGELYDMKMQLASAYHEDWRTVNQSNEDGTFRPRIKVKLEDQNGKTKWVNEGADVPEGFSEVFRQDIANTDFEDLDPQWQRENMDAAAVVVSYLDSVGPGASLEDQATRNNAGNTVHSAWLSRNEWAKGGDLDKPFEELPLDEQEKDIAQVNIALGLFQK